LKVARHLSSDVPNKFKSKPHPLLDIDGNVATIRMSNGRANVLDYEYVIELRKAIFKAESDPSVNALVLTSNKSGVFSGGLDLNEFHDPKHERVCAYWFEVQSLAADLYGSRLSTVARMNGHSVAAGCVLALCSDFRVMLAPSSAGTAGDPAQAQMKKPPSTGLNEVALGMTMPWWISRLLADVVGTRQAERLVCQATLLPAPDAQRLGLLDAVASSEAELDQIVAAELQRALRVTPRALGANKRALRGALLGEIRARLAQDASDFASEITSDELQEVITAYLASLTRN